MTASELVAANHEVPPWRPATGEGTLRVVTYHRVEWENEYPDLYPRLNSCNPKVFARQLDFYRSNFDVVSLEDVLSHVRGDSSLPRRALLITFDDAYECFHTNVWPLVKQRQLPITLFVPTAFPDNPDKVFWWDRLFYALKTTERRRITIQGHNYALDTYASRRKAFKQLRSIVKRQPHSRALALVEEIHKVAEVPKCPSHVLGWDALRKLAAEGVQLAPHTRTHPMLNRLPTDEAVEEAVGSMNDLAEHVGCGRVPCLAYPAGGLTPDVARAVKRAGFELAFGTKRGINSLAALDVMGLHRINVGARTSLFALRAQLSAFFPFCVLPN